MRSPIWSLVFASAVMSAIFATAIATVVVVGSCGSLKQEIKAIENGEIACLKAEELALKKQVSVITIAVDAVAALAVALSGDPVAAIDALIVKYSPTLGTAAEATIACAVNVVANGGATPGVGSGSATPPKAGGAQSLAAKQVIAKHGWRFRAGQ